MHKENLSSRLRLARKGRGLTQVELAVAAGLAPGTLARWEHNPPTPRRAQLAAVAAVLGVTPEWLLRGQEAAS